MDNWGHREVTYLTTRLMISPEWHEEIDENIRQEIHAAGEFEAYFAVEETPERLHTFTINRDYYYSIWQRQKEQLIGYLGFSKNADIWEPEIYIFPKYRMNGYGREALKLMLEEFFSDLLSDYEFDEGESYPTFVTATVREENTASRRLMESLGFTKVATCWMALVSLEEEDLNLMPVVQYNATAE